MGFFLGSLQVFFQGFLPGIPLGIISGVSPSMPKWIPPENFFKNVCWAATNDSFMDSSRNSFWFLQEFLHWFLPRFFQRFHSCRGSRFLSRILPLFLILIFKNCFRSHFFSVFFYWFPRVSIRDFLQKSIQFSFKYSSWDSFRNSFGDFSCFVFLRTPSSISLGNPWLILPGFHIGTSSRFP